MTKSSLFGTGILLATLCGCFESSSSAEDSAPQAPATPPPSAQVRDSLPIRITEISPGNSSLVDQFGEDPGWLELENRSPDSVDLSRYSLSGRPKDGPAWRLPPIRLAPHARQLVFASGKDLPDESPATDSISPTITSSGRWSDIDAKPDAGLSRVRGWEFGSGKFLGILPDGTTAYSWDLILGDNQTVDLPWSSAEATVGFATVNLNTRERLWLEATIPAGQSILVGMCQEDVECWKAPQIRLVGTGKTLDHYDVALSEFPGDRSKTSGFRFTPPKNLVGSFKLTFARFGFYKAGRHPHASFKLQREGALLVLSDTIKGLRDTVQYPSIEGDGSWALDSSTGKWSVTERPTPGRANPVLPHEPIVAAPRFATPPGFHASPFSIRLEPISGLQIRCALGGSTPTSASPLAESGIRLDSSATATCAAFSADGAHGPVTTGTFLLDMPKNLGVIAISADSSALFDKDTGLTTFGPNASAISPYFGANFWKDKEIPAHVELFENGARSFSIRSGISIFGNFSRSAPKKSFSIQFREKYGPTHLKHPLFPHHPQYTKFKGFGLRNNGGNYGRDYVRDALMTSLTEQRGQDYQLSRHVVVYINGRYAGIYDLREKLDADWADTRHGIDPDNVDLIKNHTEVQAGSIADWNDLRKTINALAPDDETGWSKIANRLDIDNTMDYLAAELYWQNTDWPSNNARCWRRNGPASKWRMMMFDMDFGMGSNGGDHTEDPFTRMIDSSKDWDSYPNGQGSTVIARRIFGRKILRDRFLNRMLVQMATNLSPQAATRAYDSMRTYIGSEVDLDVKRWSVDPAKLTSADAEIRQFINNRGSSLRETMGTVFALEAPRSLSLSAPGGSLLIEDMPVGESYAYFHFPGVPIQVEAVGKSGSTFQDWSDGVTSARRTVTPGADSVSLVARFR
ncbi:MAG: CotH kinase family protein [Fibrobacterota bacterium]|nr:CotH kinase family protein [Fibrobacterota bacterium]QQS07216.1 MAG: CotH kinase family protein [Fibrobacterota bacterium]